MKGNIYRNKEIYRKLEDYGVDQKDIIILVEALEYADSRGDPSHGLNKISYVFNQLSNKSCRAQVKLTILKEYGALTLVDANYGLGPPSIIKAVEIAKQKVKKFGIGIVGIQKINHIFALGYYVYKIAEEDLIGFICCNTPPAMSYPSSTEKILGTNPLAIGIPSFKTPLVFDMSTTVTARGRIHQALLESKEIPIHWARDKRGHPTTDPKKALDGFLNPLGGRKGFMLSMAVDILAGILTSSAYSTEVTGPSIHLSSKHLTHLPNNGVLLAVLDPSKFISIGDLKEKVGKHPGLKYLKFVRMK